MQVIPCSEHELLNDVLLVMIDLFLKFPPVLCYKETAPALCAMILHDDGTCDLIGRPVFGGHRNAGTGQPLALFYPVRFPFEHLLIPKTRDIEACKV